MADLAWRQLENLFARAAPLGADDRGSLLDRECARQPELRQQLDELLAADQQLSATWPGLTFGESSTGTASSDIGQLEIPGYQCIRRLGEGGMGVVYLALRQDEIFDGKAFAVKVLHRHRAGDLGKKRFAAERRLLAALDHPHIVRLYDGGELADGRPYLVMDYVEGQSLTRYCEAGRLTIRERLVLFRQICSTLHHAHQNLVVHRDLKPSNILVDSEGVPHLLDFGIAKRLPNAIDDLATTGWLVPMTPAYASPEQLDGKVISTASDLYSLGLMLHELLVDGLPDIGTSKPSRYVASVADATDLAGARRTTAARLQRRIEGDLDHIVAKLLRREPEARYASARELADDIDRHLNDMPILARRGNWRYITGRFLRRRRVGILAACSSLVVVALAAAAWVQSERLQRSEAATEQRDRIMRRLAGPASDFLLAQGGLDQVVPAIVGLKLPEEGKALILDTVRRLHLPEDQVFERTIGVFRRAAEEGAVDAGAVDADVADVAHTLGRLLFEGNHFAHSEEVLRLAATIARQVYRSDDPALAPYFDLHGRVLAELERYDEGIVALRRSIELRGEDPQITITVSHLAGLLFLQGSFAESAAACRQGLAVLEEREDGAAQRASLLTSLSVALMEMAEDDPTDEAETAAREALAIHLENTGPEHVMTLAARNNLAAVLGRKGKLQQSMMLAEENLELAARILGAEHPRMAYIHNQLASGHHQLGDSAECERQARRAVDLRQRKLPAGSWLTAFSQLRLGACLADLERYGEALETLRASVKGMAASKVEDRKWLDVGWAEIARVEEQLEDPLED